MDAGCRGSIKHFLLGGSGIAVTQVFKNRIRKQAVGSANFSVDPADAEISVGRWKAGADGVITLPVGTTVHDAEKAMIFLTLAHTKSNKTRAAEILGISLKTLFNKLKEYGSSTQAEAEVP